MAYIILIVISSLIGVIIGKYHERCKSDVNVYCDEYTMNVCFGASFNYRKFKFLALNEMKNAITNAIKLGITRIRIHYRYGGMEHEYDMSYGITQDEILKKESTTIDLICYNNQM